MGTTWNREGGVQWSELQIVTGREKESCHAEKKNPEVSKWAELMMWHKKIKGSVSGQCMQECPS